jgi:hypothetical protein
MLFTDNPAIAIEDLADYETAILGTAQTEAINLTVKIGLAINEIGLQLQSRFTPLGVNGIFPLPRLTLSNIVVTPPLRLWLLFHTLELVYRDAYFSQLNDRYQAKWNEYKDLSTSAAALLFQIGVGTVANPILQAVHPKLSLVAGSLAPAKYFIEVSWMNVTGQEGGPSETTALDVTAGNTLQVQALSPPANAVSWNVYAGVQPGALSLQNTASLNPSASWTAPNAGLSTTGQPPGTGQPPAYLQPQARILLRG